MGERGNIVVDGVYMYAHWRGHELKQILQAALKHRERWNDSQYFARIVFSEMIKDDVEGMTGFGLGLKMGDNNYNILVVDTKTQQITEHEVKKDKLVSKPVKTWSFEEFSELKLEDVE